MQSIDKKTQTGSEIFLKTIYKLGIDKIFGYPGSAVLSIYDSLSRQDKIKHYLFRHEQYAVHAAEGYARVSGRCGCVLVTSGPGATNTVTGIANAYLDAYPLLVIAGQVDSRSLGSGAFQEIDFAEIAKPCAKAVFRVRKSADLESVIMQAYIIAMSGKKGPVVIEVSKDVFEDNSAEYKNLILPSDEKIISGKVDVESVINILKNAKSPLIVCGGGVIHSGAEDELEKFSKSFSIPVVSTMNGINALSFNFPNYEGMLGIYGDEVANDKLKLADVILVLGARLNDRITSLLNSTEFKAKITIQVDINVNEAENNFIPDIFVNSDIKEFLNFLLSKSQTSNINSDFKSSEKVKFELKDDNNKILIKDVITILNSLVPESIKAIVSEVGQHQISLIKNYNFDRNHKLITSCGLGAMGFGFPAAIGASIAADFAPIILITGDGAFQMNSSELAVCAEYGIPVKIMIMNNGYLGMVKQLQEERFEGNVFETKLKNPDFEKLVNSYGIECVKVQKYSEIIPAITKAFEVDGPFVIEFKTDSSENV